MLTAKAEYLFIQQVFVYWMNQNLGGKIADHVFIDCIRMDGWKEGMSGK